MYSRLAQRAPIEASPRAWDSGADRPAMGRHLSSNGSNYCPGSPAAWEREVARLRAGVAAETELAVGVVTPAIGFAARGHTAGMVAHAHAHSAEQEATQYCRRAGSIGFGAVAQGAGEVVAPTVRLVEGRDAADPSRSNQLVEAEARDQHWSAIGRPAVPLVGCGPPAPGVYLAKADPARNQGRDVMVTAPTVSLVVGGHPAGIARCPDPAEPKPTRDRDWGVPFGSGTISQLSGEVGAPAVGLVVGGHPAAVDRSRAHLSKLEAARHRRRPNSAAQAAEAQLAVIV